MVDGENWSLVKDLFERCLSEDETARMKILSGAGLTPEVVHEVRRLLNHHDGVKEDFLAPLAPVRQLMRQRQFEGGTVLGGRFRIRRFIGAGGMGEVYGAEDLARNDLIVAIKVVRRDLSSNEVVTKRFAQEWRLASAISHPNICRFGEFFEDFSIGPTEAGTVCLFTMEFIEGETLATFLKAAGKVDLNEAAAISFQLLEGLAHIHSLGVVHRDLKPANIMLRRAHEAARSNRIVITDFGLARHESRDLSESLSRTGDIVGTLAYLSPEQLQGQPITALSDIYAFGVIVFEMLTGELPFRCDVPEAVLTRLRSRAPSLRRWRIPEPWKTLTAACLERKPAMRPGSAREVQKLLGGGGSLPLLLHARVRRRGLLTGIGAFAFSAVGAAYWIGQLHTERGVAVMVADVAKGTDEEIALGLQLKRTLLQSTYLTLWSTDELNDLWLSMGKKLPAEPDEAEWREIAFRAGVPLLLFAKFPRVAQETARGRKFSLRLEEITSNPEYPHRTWEREFGAGKKEELLEAIKDAAVWVRSMVGEARSEITASDQSAESVTTPSWRALLEFGSGEKALLASDYATAQVKFDAALRFDPDFSMAWMRKGDLQFRLSNEPEGFAAYEKALEAFKTRPLTRREDLRFRSMLMSDASDYVQAEKLFAEYYHYFPAESYGPFYRSLPLLLLGHVDEAITSLKIAEKYPDRGLRAEMHLAWCMVANADYSGARREIAKLRNQSYPPGADYAQAVLDYVVGDTDSALAALKKAQSDPGLLDESWVRLLRVSGLAEAGRNDDAMKEALNNAKLDGERGARVNRTFNLISAAYLLNDLGDAQQVRRVLDSIDTETIGFMQMRHVGALYARCGWTEKCRELLQRVPTKSSFPRVSITRFRLLGEIDLVENRLVSGLSFMREAAGLDVKAYGKDYLAYALWKNRRTADALAEYEACQRQKSFQFRVAEPEPAGCCLRAANQSHLIKRDS